MHKNEPYLLLEVIFAKKMNNEKKASSDFGNLGDGKLIPRLSKLWMFRKWPLTNPGYTIDILHYLTRLA